MKKIIGIIFVSLMFCNIGFANTPVDFEILNYNVNDLTKRGYKITFVNGEESNLYYTLEKDNDVVVCQLYMSSNKTYCYKP